MYVCLYFGFSFGLLYFILGFCECYSELISMFHIGVLTLRMFNCCF